MEHFCGDAILIHSNDGEVIGLICVFYHISSLNPALACIAPTAAKLIEQNFANDRYSKYVSETIENVSEGVLIVDSGFRIIKTNKSFLDMIKEDEEAVLNSNVAGLFKDVDFDAVRRSGTRQTAIDEMLLTYHEKNFRLDTHISTLYMGKIFDGFVIFCREIKDIITLSQKFTAKPIIKFSDIITGDRAMLELIAQCKKMAPLPITILLEGESGTGKELFAQSIHNASPRRGKPFVAVNCAALPVNLVESELFGYERGAFSGALSTGSAGKFEQADGGTIFLDEIGELPLDIQGKLLRMLDNHILTRIGGSKERKLDIRILAATNRDLYQEVTLNNFRADLYFRLSEMEFRLPALNERQGDIPLLIRYFLDKLNAGKPVSKQMSREALDRLGTYTWKGNVRELQHAVTHAYYLCEGETVTCD